MSQAARAFSKLEYIGNAAQVAAVTSRIAPGLNRRRIYPYLFAIWDGAHIPNVVLASLRFYRGGVESATLPIVSLQTGALVPNTNPGSFFGLAGGGNAERDSLVLYPGSIQGGTLPSGGPLAGEAASAILQPFYMNVDADEFQLWVDYCSWVTAYRIFVAVFSDLLNNQGL